MKKKNYNIKAREKQLIGIDDIKINKEYMQELYKLIMEDFKDIFDQDKDEYKIKLTLINAKKSLSLF